MPAVKTRCGNESKMVSVSVPHVPNFSSSQCPTPNTAYLTNIPVPNTMLNMSKKIPTIKAATAFSLLIILLLSASCSKNSVKKPVTYQGPEKIRFAINPMTELDFKTKSEVLESRKKYVNEHPQLAKYLTQGEYEPSDAVFGQIEDGKSWWGIWGLYYYGRGEKSIEGPSEETRYINNPYLLVGIGEMYFQYGKVDPSKYNPDEAYPCPTGFTWDMKEKKYSVEYDINSYLTKAIVLKFYQPRELSFVMYNAKDLGYRFFYIIPEETKNIKYPEQKEALLIPQFIHTGPSSGYPGGSNNMSPSFPPLDFIVEKIPARAVINLWKNRPKSIKEKPDMQAVVDMK